MSKFVDSPVEQICVDGFALYIKRDDLLDADFAGNKARKFYYLLQHDFDGIETLISYGSPQANSLYCLSVLAKMRQLKLRYYVRHIPSLLVQKPSGNYQAALANGAEIIALGEQIASGEHLEDHVKAVILPTQQQALYIPEGGRCEDAALGVNMLADEIIAWAQAQGFNQLLVTLPSGTGTTALLLQRRFKQRQSQIQVLTCACVGGDDYLKRQFSELAEHDSVHPQILNQGKKYHFGKLYPEFYQMWQRLMQQTNIEFDLLYDPLGWLLLLDYLAKTKTTSTTPMPVLYIHQGGTLGNPSMLSRYSRQ